MKILSINISHHSSICVYENKKIIEFYNEERFIFVKNYDLNEKLKIFQSILQKINFKPDFVCYASFGTNYQYCEYDDQKIIEALQKQLDNPPYFFNQREHHLYHAICSYYFSSFEEAVAIVIDGGGACNFYIPFQEIESIYKINKKSIIPLFKHHTRWRSNKLIGDKENSFSIINYINGFKNKFSDMSVGGIDFEKACLKLGYPNSYESGKVMGLSSYAYSKEKYNLDYDKVNIAKEVQEKTFKDTCILIEEAKKINKNILLLKFRYYSMK